MPSRPPTLTVACFGEALWDILPRGLFLGGAILNAAYHLSRHGLRAWPVSAAGRDFLGDEILRRVADWGIETRFITRPAGRPTGSARATLDEKGVATHRIAGNVAWDRIAAPAALLRSAAPAAVVFGTLALREQHNRRTLDRLLEAWPGSLRVLDLNLRAPFDQAAVIDYALERAQLLKVNDAELTRLTLSPGRTIAALEEAARRLAGRRKLSRICVTAGARGAGLLWDDQWYWEQARNVDVRDTVGSGDAFLGSLLAAVLRRRAPRGTELATACRMGEFVATRDGPTPTYRVNARGQLRESKA